MRSNGKGARHAIMAARGGDAGMAAQVVKLIERGAGAGLLRGHMRPIAGQQAGRHPSHAAAAGRVDEGRLLARWIAAMQAEPDCCPEAVLMLLVQDASFSAVDRRWRRRKGWARGQLEHALHLFAQTRLTNGGDLSTK